MQQTKLIKAALQALGLREDSYMDSAALAGGDINQALRLRTKDGTFFLKYNRLSAEDMLQTEVKSLAALREHSPLHIPEVLGLGKTEENAFMLLAFIESGPKSSHFWESLGQGLAKQHSVSAAYYGLGHDNYIGSLAQPNKQTVDWVGFFIEQRLQPQIERARSHGLLDDSDTRSFERLQAQLPSILNEARPSLLHGDLWSGNILADRSGKPYLIDPAVYYGHPEIELAFTQLFGGFHARFYGAYQEIRPIEAGFSERAAIYNLYPLLVHLNLFGKSYYSAVKKVIEQF